MSGYTEPDVVTETTSLLSTNVVLPVECDRMLTFVSLRMDFLEGKKKLTSKTYTYDRIKCNLFVTELCHIQIPMAVKWLYDFLASFDVIGCLLRYICLRIWHVKFDLRALQQKVDILLRTNH